ncbi:MAG: hypothetical protein MUC68_12530 [Burkholderiaceae bacterium]|jgi:hypothetical protein|nr:hypothetical protein [Burkholderiaceae bacterium]
MSQRLQFRPRNPLVALARQRIAGAHGGGRKTERQAQDRALRHTLAALGDDRERHRHR